jgi:hypothetical protein
MLSLLHLHNAVSCSSQSECSQGIHSVFSLLLLNVNIHQFQHVTDFTYPFLPFTCCGIISDTWNVQHTHEQHNKQNIRATSVQSLGMLIAESAMLPQLRDFRLWTRWKWNMRFWYFMQRRLVVSCERFGTTVGGREILTAVLVKIQLTWYGWPCRLVNFPSSSGPTAQDEGTTSHRNVRNPSPVEGA